MQRADRNTYSNDTVRAHNTAKIQIEFALDNIETLIMNDKKKTNVKALVSFIKMLINHEPFTKNQLSYIDGIYEAVMKAYDLPSIPLHIDKKRKGIRY